MCAVCMHSKQQQATAHLQMKVTFEENYEAAEWRKLNWTSGVARRVATISNQTELDECRQTQHKGVIAS